jgi:predicted deacylase
VNVFGFHNRSRYLPDRRDLNRSFPGSEHGSMASRVANLFLREVVQRADYGIDLHTAAIDRDNLPQIRADLSNPEMEQLANTFGAPVVINSSGMEGSLRIAAAAAGVPVMLYEAGEALRFSEVCIRTGLRGIIESMRALEMLPRRKRSGRPPVLVRSSTWVRAPQSGILRGLVPLGASVSKGDTLAIVSDPFGEREETISATTDGVIIGRATLPLVFEGEALFHIGRSKSAEAVEEHFEALQLELNDPIEEVPDEPIIV